MLRSVRLSIGPRPARHAAPRPGHQSCEDCGYAYRCRSAVIGRGRIVSPCDNPFWMSYTCCVVRTKKVNVAESFLSKNKMLRFSLLSHL